MPRALLLWYGGLTLCLSFDPVNRDNWLLANVLPVLFVLAGVATYRLYRLSNASYFFLTLFLSLHAIGAHYTYARTPFGFWLNDVLRLGDLTLADGTTAVRNQYDRIVHFCFGLLLAYPLEELFRRTTQVKGWLIYYLPIMTVMALAGIWEIIESLVAQWTQPELGLTFVGYQGDIWDAQEDMAVALYGATLVMAITIFLRRVRASAQLAKVVEEQ